MPSPFSKKTLATVVVGNSPESVAVSRNSGRVYVTNTGSNNVSVIDPFKNTVVATVNVGNSPAAVATQPE